MSRVYLLAAVTALALVICVAPAFGGVIQPAIWHFAWQADDWNVDPNTNIPFVQMDNIEWPPDWGCDGECILRLTGPRPCADDPDVIEVVRNLTDLVWTGWHVSIENGIIRQAVVGKVGGPSWMVKINQDGSGFDAYTALESGRIGPMEQLDVWFRFDMAGAGDVVIDEYPTTTYIPEPASVAALLFGTAAFGLRFRRQAH